jgi:hypothetical protein
MNFFINVNPIRHNIESISLSMPYSSKIVVSELEKENWKTSSNDFSDLKRYVLVDPQSNILKEIKEFLTSSKIKEKIINSFYDSFPNIQNVWNGWTKQQMIERTVWDGVFIKDLPGFSMSKHLDSRTNVATAIVYLNEEADEKRTTTFYTDKNGSDQLKIDNSFGQGVISINDSNTWHDVHNNTAEPRYVILIVLLLLIDFYDAEKHSSLFSPPPRLTL